MKRFWLVVAALSLAACQGKVSTPGTGGDPGSPSGGSGPGAGGAGGSGMMMEPAGPPPPPPYEALAPGSYAAKVKDLLTGQPLTNDELAAVTANRGALPGLVDAWAQTPQFKERMFDFFKRSFQQTQLDITDLDDQLRLNSANLNRTDQQRMLKAIEDSFPRTVMALLDEKRPFTEAVTTTRFMMNVPLMVALAYMDAAPRNDTGRVVANGFWVMNKFGGAQAFKLQMVTGLDPLTGLTAPPIPFEETINPASPNFMKLTFTQPDPMRYMPCVEPVVVMGTRAVERVFGAIFGSRDACQGAPDAVSQFTEADWNTWKLVEVRPPAAGEERTLFWDLPRMRDPGTKALVLATPRVGFMTTPAFFSNWPTNPSNSYRVTTNQALIVGLGKSFDDRSTTVQVSETSVDAQHVQPGTACFACHQILDPMRDFFKQSYSLTYFQQLDLANKRNPIPATATFSVDATTVTGSGVPAFAKAMAEHPLFPMAWARKLCQYANSSECPETDPELQRVAAKFRDSNFDFHTLVRELFSSPLVTYTQSTRTAEEIGVTIGIARREALCARLSTRLNTADVCNLKGETALPRNLATSAVNLSAGVAGSTYARADVQPVMPHDPNLFFASATEKLCMMLAGHLVETATGPWKVAGKDAALDDFVHLLMGIPPADERAPLLRGILARHYDAAVAAKEKAPDALRSSFVLACSSPLAISSGL